MTSQPKSKDGQGFDDPSTSGQIRRPQPNVWVINPNGHRNRDPDWLCEDEDDKPQRRFKVQYLSGIDPRPVDWMWKPWFARREGLHPRRRSRRRNRLSRWIGRPRYLAVRTGPKLGSALRFYRVISPIPAVWSWSAWKMICNPSCRDSLRMALIRTKIATMIRDTDYKGNPKPFVIPDDIDELRYHINEVGATFVPIDPITAFLSTKLAKAGDDPSTRQALMPLAELAEETDCAIILLRHWNKAAGMSAKYRGSGTIAYGGLARSVLTAAELTKSHGNGATHAMAVAKSNLAEQPWVTSWSRQRITPRLRC